MERRKIDGYRLRGREICGASRKNPYAEKKEDARQLAIEIQSDLAEEAASYDELAEIQGILYTLAKNTGLIKEFIENGVL